MKHLDGCNFAHDPKITDSILSLLWRTADPSTFFPQQILRTFPHLGLIPRAAVASTIHQSRPWVATPWRADPQGYATIRTSASLAHQIRPVCRSFYLVQPADRHIAFHHSYTTYKSSSIGAQYSTTEQRKLYTNVPWAWRCRVTERRATRATARRLAMTFFLFLCYCTNRDGVAEHMSSCI